MQLATAFNVLFAKLPLLHHLLYSGAYRGLLTPGANQPKLTLFYKITPPKSQFGAPKLALYNEKFSAPGAKAPIAPPCYATVLN